VFKSNPLYVKYYFIILAICLSLDFNFLQHGFDLSFSSFLCILFSPILWLLGLDISTQTICNKKKKQQFETIRNWNQPASENNSEKLCLCMYPFDEDDILFGSLQQ